MHQGKSKYFQRETNVSLVLTLIRNSSSGISRIEIAKQLGLNRSTITYIVNQLLDQQAVQESTEGCSGKKGGRRPVYIRLNPSFGCTLGIEIQIHFCRLTLLDFSGSIIHSQTLTFPQELTLLEQKFFYAFQIASHEAKKQDLPLIGVGVGVPGQVNPHTGEIIHSFALQIRDYNFFNSIAYHYSVPIIIDNDANCCAAGELFALGKDAPHNFLYLLTKYHTDSRDYPETGVGGVGMGIVIDNSIYYGNSYRAGEFRSVFWKSKTREHVGIPTEELRNIRTDKHVLLKFIREICLNLSVIISVLNPGRIYIGGDLQQDFELVKSVIADDFHDSFISQEDTGCEILKADYNEYDVAAGAGYLFLARLFAPPEIKRIDANYHLDWNSVFSRLASARG